MEPSSRSCFTTGGICSASVFNRRIATQSGLNKAIALLDDISSPRSPLIEKLHENFAHSLGKFYTALMKKLRA